VLVPLFVPALIAAFVVTLIEMTEVVALVFAFGLPHGTVRHGTYGAIAGTALVTVVAVGAGAALLAVPRHILLLASAIVLAGFGVFLFRSTLKSYRRARAAGAETPGVVPAAPPRRAVQFAGGFSVGVVESIEAVIVLLALAAAGFADSAILGAVAAGAVLVGLAVALHEQMRRVKVPLLKLGATSLLFSFSLFWGGEAFAVPWPGADLVLLPMFVVALLVTRAVIGSMVPPPPAGVPVQTNS
jgi:uncharacterized membrane protein